GDHHRAGYRARAIRADAGGRGEWRAQCGRLMALPELLQPTDRADIGVFGGSGFYSLLEGPVEQVSVQTPYGSPSDSIAVGQMGAVRVAFLPRHGPHHRIPPHAINYRANLWAMALLGVTRLVAPTAAGSLQP